MTYAIFTRLLVFVGLLAPAAIWLLSPSQYTQIGSLAFSPDGKRLAVVRVDAEDAQVPFKGYKANLGRTISLVDVASARVSRVVWRDFAPGDHGPAWQYWRGARAALAFDATGQSLFVRDFAGADIRRLDLATGESTAFFTPAESYSVAELCPSTDHTRLAVDGFGWLGLIDTTSGELLAKRLGTDNFHGDGDSIACSPDDRWLGVSDGGYLRFYDVDGGLAPGPHVECRGPFAFLPGGDQVAVAINEDIKICSLDGKVARTFSVPDTVLELAPTPDGRYLVAACPNAVLLLLREHGDLASGPPYSGRTSALACSPDGKLVALGNASGEVTLWDLTDSNVHRISIPSNAKTRWPLVVTWLGPVTACAWMVRQRRAGRPILPKSARESDLFLSLCTLLVVGFLILLYVLAAAGALR